MVCELVKMIWMWFCLYHRLADRLGAVLKNDIVLKLIEKLKLSLPDEFLKRWLMAVNDKPISYEQVTAEYNSYSNGLRWQLIENKILKNNEIKISNTSHKDIPKIQMIKQHNSGKIP